MMNQGAMCGWEEDDYETANKQMFRKAGISQIKTEDDPQKKVVQAPMVKRAERVPSQERVNRWRHDKAENEALDKESGQKKWFHDKFAFEDNQEERKASNDRSDRDRYSRYSRNR